MWSSNCVFPSTVCIWLNKRNKIANNLISVFVFNLEKLNKIKIKHLILNNKCRAIEEQLPFCLIRVRGILSNSRIWSHMSMSTCLYSILATSLANSSVSCAVRLNKTFLIYNACNYSILVWPGSLFFSLLSAPWQCNKCGLNEFDAIFCLFVQEVARLLKRDEGSSYLPKCQTN